jgi:hypothetical protein
VRWLNTGMLILFATSTGWSQQPKLSEILVAAVNQSDQNPAEAERQYKSALRDMETGSFEIERSIVFWAAYQFVLYTRAIRRSG